MATFEVNDLDTVTPVRQLKKSAVSPHSPLAPTTANLLLRQLHDNQRKQARKYSVQNLYQIRHCFREMDENVTPIPNVLAPGLGLTLHLKSPISKQVAARRKQVELGKKTEGYVNYINLIPKKCRKPHHPRTPDFSAQNLSKRRFLGTVSAWRRQLHEWDNIKTFDDIPEHLQPKKLSKKRKETDRIQYQQRQNLQYSPVSRNKQMNDSNIDYVNEVDSIKNSDSYQHYCRLIPKNGRIDGVHPQTPNIPSSGLEGELFGQKVRTWHRMIHKFDPFVCIDDLPPALRPEIMMPNAKNNKLNQSQNDEFFYEKNAKWRVKEVKEMKEFKEAKEVKHIEMEVRVDGNEEEKFGASPEKAMESDGQMGDGLDYLRHFNFEPLHLEKLYKTGSELSKVPKKIANMNIATGGSANNEQSLDETKHDNTSMLDELQQFSQRRKISFTSSHGSNDDDPDPDDVHSVHSVHSTSDLMSPEIQCVIKQDAIDTLKRVLDQMNQERGDSNDTDTHKTFCKDLLKRFENSL